MLISKSKRFIFVHVAKNAGTSITRCLRPFAETKLGSIIRFHPITRRTLGSFVTSQPYRTHIRADEIEAKLGPRAFRSYFSFAIVRNPWDRHVSFYHYKLKKTKSSTHEMYKAFGSFDNYIRWACEHKPMGQVGFVCSKDNKQIVSFVGRYENLDDDFRKICQEIGIPPQELPKLNASVPHAYREFYTDETRELVRKANAPDIAMFGYDF